MLAIELADRPTTVEEANAGAQELVGAIGDAALELGFSIGASEDVSTSGGISIYARAQP